MKTFFSCDSHFGHDRIREYCLRPFVSVEQMDAEIIGRHNEVVSKKDTVYLLGDITLGNTVAARKYLSQLNGKIFVVPGGHDYRWVKHIKTGVMFYYGKTQITLLPPIFECKINKRLFVMCHYPMRSWRGSHHTPSSIHLHGHSHGNLTPNGAAVDVGVDCWEYYPVSLEEILERVE